MTIDQRAVRQRSKGNITSASATQESAADGMPPSIRQRTFSESLAFIAVFSLVAGITALTAYTTFRPASKPWVLHRDSSKTPALAANGVQHDVSDIRQSMHIDYERRLEAATRGGRKLPVLTYLRWLHIPKTGTSIVNTFVRWGCTNISQDTFVVPRLERPKDLEVSVEATFMWDWFFRNKTGRQWLDDHCKDRLVTPHPTTKKNEYSFHLHRPLQRWEIPHTASVFRMPRQRSYSNYMHLSKHYNESRQPFETLYDFLKREEFWSQHAKLLLGRKYRDQRVITIPEARTAAKIVSDHIAFAGLTEEFRLSCRLFHAMFGGVPHLLQFENVRPGLDRYKHKGRRTESFRYDETEFKDWRDEADEIVYEAARNRFWNDVRKWKDEIELDGLGPVHIKQSV
ncbi:hypothetical protein BWQ96_04005 [Gracilariopsis chorda]|uniref:Uncharacterized protein n=1 Tax=Gracilariopsis chorda TaxID=448386 RepID=A0A2V3IYK9_9FLOR|nr:hypothetical protein BWQ96_04005 [Gracilariopsis chorda]|eukprot:PXF46220.1 hypothetical protein BWQ96_04005 [Gracilariopsis chorda]